MLAVCGRHICSCVRLSEHSLADFCDIPKNIGWLALPLGEVGKRSLAAEHKRRIYTRAVAASDVRIKTVTDQQGLRRAAAALRAIASSAISGSGLR